MEIKGRRHLKTGFPLVIFVAALLISAPAPVFASDTVEAQEIVNQARATLEWSQPAFYTIGAVSFGLQVGIEGAEVVVLVMTQKAVASLLTSSFKLGGDISAAGGPQGVGVKSDVTAHFISFAKAKGIFIGLDLEGSVISVREGLNQAYYGKEVTPEDIIVNNEVHNHRSIELRTALKNSAQ